VPPVCKFSGPLIEITPQRVGTEENVYRLWLQRLHCTNAKPAPSTQSIDEANHYQPHRCDKIFIKHGQTPLFRGAMMDRGWAASWRQPALEEMRCRSLYIR
jgi:hypothetical protein